MDYPVFSLKSTTYRKVSTVNQVFNLYQFEPYLWVEIPHELNFDFSFGGVFYLTRNSDDDDIEDDITPYCEREPFKPWIKIQSDKLSKDIGLHTYRIELINRFSNDVVSMYFNYTVQNDNPPEPYNYMKEIRDAWTT